MDCASCVSKVTRAAERLPGVSEVEVNLMAERLSLRLAPGSTTPQAVRQQVAALGDELTALAEEDSPRNPTRPHGHAGHDHGRHHGHAHGEEDAEEAGRPWFATGRAQLVWLIAALVIAAFLAAHWPAPRCWSRSARCGCCAGVWLGRDPSWRRVEALASGLRLQVVPQEVQHHRAPSWRVLQA